MTPLRKQMIEAMQLRGFSPRTHQAYLQAVEQLSSYYGRSPATLSTDELQGYFKYLVIERGLAPASCRVYLNGVRFLYLKVLGWSDFDVPLVTPKRVQRIPELLTRAEVARLLGVVENPKHRMLLTLCYGCGLRVSELVGVRVRDIDGERRLLHVVQGKGAKDRQVLLGSTLLRALRGYWSLERPRAWLFPNGSRREVAVTVSTAQRVYTRAKQRAGVQKVGGIHALRHAYATHQLANGLPVHELQRLLGHRQLSSTLRYLHWAPTDRAGDGAPADLVAGLHVG